ncbi:MAG: hypothetical protein H0U76_10735 [Ktedonobacteraceae bacterium]|nr:hypothetical protein [Ktedonobacteraceae bacterium]
MAYPSEWPGILQRVVKRERWPGGYRARGVPLVYSGQIVVPDQPVLRLVQEENGARAERREEDGSTLSSSAHLSVDRVVDQSVPIDTGESIPAGLYGHVVGLTQRGGVLIESRAACIRGRIGAGLQVAGVLTMWQSLPASGSTQSIPPGAILVVSEPLTLTLLHQSINSGVVGIVAGSIALRDLEGFLRTDILQLLVSDTVERAQAYLPPLTLLFTEGVGSLPLPIYLLDFLQPYEGSIVLLSGITSVRHHIAPELVISGPTTELLGDESQSSDSTLSPGVQVRVCAGEYEGVTGRIDYLFAHERVFRAGIRARAARLRLDDESFCIVPLPLVERMR